MQDENYIKDMDELWDVDQCQILDESGCDFEAVQSSLELNKELNKIMRKSRRNWLLDSTLLRDERDGFIRFAKEKIYYLKIDLEQQAKQVIRRICSKLRRS